MADSGIDKTAASLLHRAVELDHKKRYTESLILYLEALNVLMDNMKEITNPETKNYLRTKVEAYMKRAEVLKKHVESEKKSGTYHEQIEIANNSTGHSYSSVFGRFLDNSVTVIWVEDPYIRAFHQCQNFLCACELFVKKCDNLKEINLLTTEDTKSDQKQWLEQIRNDLGSKFKVALIVSYSATLHDRQLRLNNGWVIKIGRGLDYFKAPDNKFSLGVHDLDLRMCHETKVDIYHETLTRSKQTSVV